MKIKFNKSKYELARAEKSKREQLGEKVWHGIVNLNDDIIDRDHEYTVLDLSFRFDSDPDYLPMAYASIDMNSGKYDNFPSGKVIPVPMIMFEVCDNNISRYWKVIPINETTIAMGIPAFFEGYFIDEVTDDEPEALAVYRQWKKLLDDEFNADISTDKEEF